MKDWKSLTGQPERNYIYICTSTRRRVGRCVLCVVYARSLHTSQKAALVEKPIGSRRASADREYARGINYAVYWDTDGRSTTAKYSSNIKI